MRGFEYLTKPSFLPGLAIINVVVFGVSVGIPDDPHPFLDEWGPVSLLSGFQLLCCGLIAREIHKSRPYWLWRLISWGFFFLCADEMLQLHESADRLIHWIFGIQQTALTDHIDDALIGLYGLAGVASLLAGWREVVFFLKQGWLFAVGFLCLLATIALDFSAGSVSIEIAEEGFKLAGGYFFVLGLRKCWDMARGRFQHSWTWA